MFSVKVITQLKRWHIQNNEENPIEIVYKSNTLKMNKEPYNFIISSSPPVLLKCSFFCFNFQSWGWNEKFSPAINLIFPPQYMCKKLKCIWLASVLPLVMQAQHLFEQIKFNSYYV